MTATYYGRKKIIDDLTGVTPYTWPPLYLALFTADPGLSGSLANEVTGAGYARQSLAGVMGAADSTGLSVNTVPLTVGPASADWGTITFFGFMDALVSGNMACPGVPATPRTITNGQPFQIPAGRLQLRQF